LDNTVEIKFGADTQGLEDALKRAEESIENLEGEIEKIGKGARNTGQEFELLGKNGKVFETLDKVTGGLGEEILNLGERTKDARKEAKLLGTGFKGAGASAKVAGKTMKSALISTGIGALIVLVGELIANWDLVKGAIFGADDALEKHIDSLEVALGIRSSYIGALKEEIKLNALIGKDTGELETALKAQLEKQIKINEEKEKTERADRKAKKLAFETVTGLENALEGIGFTPFNKEDKKEIDALTVSINKTSVATDRLKAELYKLTEAPEIKPVDLGEIEKTIKQFRPKLEPVDTTPLKDSITGLTDIIDTDFITKGMDNLGEEITRKLNAGTEATKAEALLLEAELLAFNDVANDIIENSLSSTFNNLGSAIGEALATGGNVLKAVGNSLLESLGGFLSEMGGMLVKYGLLAVLKGKLDLAILAGGPVSIGAGIAAIAVGIALQAAGSALGSFASSGGSSGGGGAKSSSGGGRGSGGSVNYGSGGSSGGFGSVVFEIAGTKLVGVLSKTLKENSALSGKLNVTG
jgi:hypothetical protein